MGDQFKNIKKSKIINRSNIFNSRGDDIDQGESKSKTNYLLLQNEIKSLISSGNLENALQRTKEFFVENENKDKVCLNQIILLEAQFNILNEKEKLNLISAQDADLSKNRIIDGLIYIVDKIGSV